MEPVQGRARHASFTENWFSAGKVEFAPQKEGDQSLRSALGSEPMDRASSADFSRVKSGQPRQPNLLSQCHPLSTPTGKLPAVETISIGSIASASVSVPALHLFPLSLCPSKPYCHGRVERGWGWRGDPSRSDSPSPRHADHILLLPLFSGRDALIHFPFQKI